MQSTVGEGHPAFQAASVPTKRVTASLLYRKLFTIIQKIRVKYTIGQSEFQGDMARLLLFDGDRGLRNVRWEVLASAGSTVCLAHKEYEELPSACTGYMALTTRLIQHVVIF